MCWAALQLLPHSSGNLRDRAVLRSLSRCQEPVPKGNARLRAGEGLRGAAAKGAAASFGPAFAGEELQEYALFQANPCR